MSTIVTCDYLAPANGDRIGVGHCETDFTPVHSTDLVPLKYMTDYVSSHGGGGATIQTTPPLGYQDSVIYIDAASGTKGGYITTGVQSIAGVKTFVDPPTVPDPVAATDAASKGYVDDLISVGIPDKRLFTALTGTMHLTGPATATMSYTRTGVSTNSYSAVTIAWNGFTETATAAESVFNVTETISAPYCPTGQSAVAPCMIFDDASTPKIVPGYCTITTNGVMSFRKNDQSAFTVDSSVTIYGGSCTFAVGSGKS